MNVLHWLTHPRAALARLQYYVWEKCHPDSPWLCPGTVRFCERHLHAGMTGLEFGSGRSTVWFARRLARLTSVEHHAGWYAQVERRLVVAGLANVDYRYVPLEHPEGEGERADYDPLPAYVRVADDLPNGSLDLVVADGHYRGTCIRRAAPKLKPGGLMVVDDVNFWPTLEAVPIPPGWRVVDDSTNGLKRGVIWQVV